MSTNNRLLLIRDQIREARAARKVNGQDAQIEGYDPLGDVQQLEVIQLFGKWKRLHYFRVVTATVAWVLGIYQRGAQEHNRPDKLWEVVVRPCN